MNKRTIETTRKALSGRFSNVLLCLTSSMFNATGAKKFINFKEWLMGYPHIKYLFYIVSSVIAIPWGDELYKGEKYRSNTWHGEFADRNTEEDGDLSTAPVQTYEPNDYGLYQVVVNVWEWCLNSERINLDEFNNKSSSEFYNEYWEESNDNFTTKGGSFLCHSSYYNRYRLGARNQNTVDTSSSNLGFRCVAL